MEAEAAAEDAGRELALYVREHWKGQGTGQDTGDAKLEAEGESDKVAGKVQNAVGGLKDALRGK